MEKRASADVHAFLDTSHLCASRKSTCCKLEASRDCFPRLDPELGEAESNPSRSLGFQQLPWLQLLPLGWGRPSLGESLAPGTVPSATAWMLGTGVLRSDPGLFWPDRLPPPLEQP